MAKADVLERVVRLFSLPPILYACEAETSGWCVLPAGTTICILPSHVQLMQSCLV